MNNKGLEALAALASAAPAPTEIRPVASNGQHVGSTQQQQQQEQKTCAGSACGPNDAGSVASEVSSLLLNPTQSNNSMSLAAPTPALNMQANTGIPPAAAAAQQQQWQQTVAAAAAANNLNSAAAFSAAPNLAFLAGLQQLSQADPSSLLAMQQLAYYQYLVQLQAGKGPMAAPTQSTANELSAASTSPFLGAGQAMMAAAPCTSHTTLAPKSDDTVPNAPQVLPSAAVSSASSASSTASSSSSAAAATMPPPPPPPQSTQVYPSPATGGGGSSSPASSKPTVIAPQPPPPTSVVDPAIPPPLAADDQGLVTGGNMDNRKLQKRAANRRSAQLSRKRKKQFIEELKDENDELRRKELILKSIPDLIVVFDSSGKLWFVSQSVTRFLDFDAAELEGTSFWDRLCQDSVRLLKAAFMDSLAARQADSDTAALGSGFWELRLVDKDGSQKVVTLNGVVHFAGDRPECVCSIRPREDCAVRSSSSSINKESLGSSPSQHQNESLINVVPSQSVFNSDFSSNNTPRPPSAAVSGVVKCVGPTLDGGTDKSMEVSSAVRISDSGNSSGESESASGDE